jgi:hypothetical protein
MIQGNHMKRLLLLFMLTLMSLPRFAAAQTYVLSPVPHQQFFSANGTPLSNGFICTYEGGTTSPLVTYQDSTGTLNQNPILLDAGGFANIWLPVGVFYKYVAFSSGTCSSGVQQWSVDQISANTGGGGGGAACGSGSTNQLMMWTSTTTCGNSTELDQNSTFISQASQGLAATQGVFDSGTPMPQTIDFSVPNSASPGTSKWYLAKVVSGAASLAATTDTAIQLYAVADTLVSNGQAKCSYGTTSNACLVLMGKAILYADAGGVTVNHYFGESPSVAGAITDLGATPNTPGCLGKADFIAVPGGAARIVRMGSCGTPAGGCRTGPYLAVPYYYTNPTGTVCAPSDEIFAGIDPNGPASTIDMLGVGTTAPDSAFEVDGQHPVDATGPGTDATDALNVQGGKGGNTTSVSGATAGHGSQIGIYAGDGGNAPSGSVNGDGGQTAISGGKPGSGLGSAGQFGPVWLQPEFVEPSVQYNGPVFAGLPDYCTGLHSSDFYSVDFCIAIIQPRPSVAGDGTPAHDALEVLGDVGGETTGVTGQTGGKGGGIKLGGGNGGQAPSGSTSGDGGDVVLVGGSPGGGTGSTGSNGQIILLSDLNFGGCTGEPTCDAGARGTTHYVCSTTGVADKIELCMKNAADAYAWEVVTVSP